MAIHTRQLQQYTQDNYNNTHKTTTTIHTTKKNTHKTNTTIHTTKNSTHNQQQYTQDNNNTHKIMDRGTVRNM